MKMTRRFVALRDSGLGEAVASFDSLASELTERMWREITIESGLIKVFFCSMKAVLIPTGSGLSRK